MNIRSRVVKAAIAVFTTLTVNGRFELHKKEGLMAKVFGK
jgi:hypothetical protein